MRAHVELSDSERRILVTLDEEEREALVEQMLTSVREELEWEVAVERAHQAAAVAAAAATAATPLPFWLRAANVDISRVTAELSQCGHCVSLSVARISASKERSQLAHRYS